MFAIFAALPPFWESPSDPSRVILVVTALVAFSLVAEVVYARRPLGVGA